MLRSSSVVVGLFFTSFACACSCFAVACGGSVDSPAPTDGQGGGTQGTAQTDPGASATPTTPAPSPTNPADAIGVNCTYRDVAGTATVTKLESSVDNVTMGVCHRATTRVTFTFVPADPSSPPESSSATNIGDAETFPTSCLEPAGLKVGATFALVRHDELTGTCSPKTFEIAKTSPVHACECVPCDDTGTGGCF
jgi:hypothetical protein